MIKQINIFNKIVLTIFVSTIFVGGNSVNLDTSGSEFEAIRIESHPKGLGYALKILEMDGKIIGMHFSGDQPPFIHRSEDKLSCEDMLKIKILVKQIKQKEPIQTEDYANKFYVENETESYIMVRIRYKDETEIVVYAEGDKQFSSHWMQEIWQIISKSKAGAW
jgi:hypothetical protein